MTTCSLKSLLCAALLGVSIDPVALAQSGAGVPTPADTKTSEAAVTTPPATATAAALSDEQIAGIVSAANHAEIDAGKLAVKTSKNGDVKAFAQQMIKDHTAMDGEAHRLLSTLKMQPADSEKSRELKDAAKTAAATLKSLSGTTFDKSYIDQQVSDHQKVLNDLDQTLIPTAKNLKLRALLEKARPKVATHLEHAKTLQEKLGAHT